jgi:hypothetical protein
VKVVPDTVGPVRVSGAPSLSRCVSTINKRISEGTIAECNSKVQVQVTSEPRIGRELGLKQQSLLTSVMEDGVGTTKLFGYNNNIIL